MSNIYRDIATRTSGDIYIGVVGPVRTGKSTFIKKFMETVIVPNIANEYDKKRAKDEMPQSAAGKTVMTTEPKFIPDEAVTVTLDGGEEFSCKMIDLTILRKEYIRIFIFLIDNTPLPFLFFIS